MKTTLALLCFILSSILTFSQTDSKTKAEYLVDYNRMQDYYSFEEAMKKPLDVYRLTIVKQNIDQHLVKLAQLTNLEYLYITECGLKSIPLEIFNLKKLKFLRLSYNEIWNIQKRLIPSISLLNFINPERVFS